MSTLPIRQSLHPGLLLKRIIKRHKLTQDEVAGALKVSRLTVNLLVNCKRNITPDMALRLAKVFSTSPELWYRMQKRYELSKARIEMGEKISRLTPLHREGEPIWSELPKANSTTQTPDV